MKIIHLKALVSILLVSFCFVNSEKRVKKKIKEDKSGCEAGIYDVTVQCGSSLSTSFTSKINAKELQFPSGFQKNGLVLQTSSTGDAVCNILTIEGSSSYIPYQFVSSFSPKTPVGGAYYWEASVFVYSKNTTIPITITFKYDEDWPYITSENLLKISSWINQNRLDRQAAIKADITGFLDSASIYNSATTNLAAANGGAEKVKTQISDLKLANEDLRLKVVKLYSRINTRGFNIDAATDSSQKAQIGLDAIDAKANFAKGEIEGYKTQLSNLQNQRNSYDANANNAWNSLITLRDTYKEETADYQKSFEDAFTALKSKTTSEDVKKFTTAVTTALT
jgi:hypothetical protein